MFIPFQPGVTEGAANALGGNRQVSINNAVLVTITVLHIFLCVVLIPEYGVLGAVAADAINTSLRFMYSVV